MKFKNLKYALCSDVVIEVSNGDSRKRNSDIVYRGHSQNFNLSGEFDKYNVLSVLPEKNSLCILLVLEDENYRNK